jgi:hypothetical protein
MSTFPVPTVVPFRREPGRLQAFGRVMLAVVSGLLASPGAVRAQAPAVPVAERSFTP